jgi:hypothetical protein
VKVSVVVPTFNRGPALADTLSRLCASEVDPGDAIEILVVDDGSAVPAQEAVATRWANDPSAPRNVRWLRQANAGPAAARNAGFQAAEGAVVLFVDDDILVPPDLVRGHLAAHRAHPGSVIFGLCPFAAPERPTPFRAFLDATPGDYPPDAGVLIPMPTVASGQISVERSQFSSGEGVYSSGLVTPAAEEYELAHRLTRNGVPILLAPGIRAIHDQEVDIASYCRQQYKHGLGCGEAVAKQPALRELSELRHIIDRSSTGGLKAVASGDRVRSALLALARFQEALPLPRRWRARAYHLAISAHFVAGVREGLDRFAPRQHPSVPT